MQLNSHQIKINYYSRTSQHKVQIHIFMYGLEGSRSCHYIFTIKSYNTTCEKVMQQYTRYMKVVSPLTTFVPPRRSSAWTALCLCH